MCKAQDLHVGESYMKTVIKLRLCHTANCCPTLKTTKNYVVIQDDFGGRVKIPKKQFAILVEMAQRGELQKLC